MLQPSKVGESSFESFFFQIMNEEKLCLSIHGLRLHFCQTNWQLEVFYRINPKFGHVSINNNAKCCEFLVGISYCWKLLLQWVIGSSRLTPDGSRIKKRFVFGEPEALMMILTIKYYNANFFKPFLQRPHLYGR